MERLNQLLKEGGIRHCVSRLCHKAISPFLEYGSTIFFELDLEGISNQCPAPSPFLVFQAKLEDASRLLKSSDGSRTLDQIERRFRQGQICFAAADPAGVIVHSTWCAAERARIDELNREIVLTSGEVYVYDSYTIPSYRGKGASKALQLFMLDALRRKGYIRLLAYVRGNNIPMLHGVRPTHRKTGRLFYFRFFGKLPIVLGMPVRTLPMLVHPNALPDLKEIPIAPEAGNVLADESKRSAAATAGSHPGQS